jgi:alpha-tubulin suppressor-like RCC1 family protein
MQRLGFITLLLLFQATGWGAPLQVDITPLQRRSVPECGVKQYVQKNNHPSCGVDHYKTDEGPACGVKLHKEKRARTCGVELYKEGLGGPCGYNEITKKTCRVRNPISGNCAIHGEEVIDRRGKSCRHEDFGVERYKPCRRAEFGVEKYESCADPSFGTVYKNCRLPEFGVESYKTCEIRKTTQELDVYLAATEPYIDINAINMAKAQTNYLFQAGQKKQVSCLIERWENDPLYFEVVQDLINTYAASFGEEYVAGAFDCTSPNQLPRVTFNGQTCDALTATDISDRLGDSNLNPGERQFLNTCQELKIYQSYKNWFKDNLVEVHNLLKDVVAQTTPAYRDELAAMAERLAAVKLADLEAATTKLGQTLSSGDDHTCVLQESGELTCWGRNNQGQLGLGFTSQYEATPQAVANLTDVRDISAGDDFTCAVLQSGQVKCWGWNLFGQLGQPEAAQAESTPVTVSGIDQAVQVRTGQSHACALLKSGQVQCWGWNFAGQLGHGRIGDKETTPVTVEGLSDVMQIDAAGYHSCALLKLGQVKCWGSNQYGQLGNGELGRETNQATPTAVSELFQVKQIALSDRHSCALRTDGQVKCWGANFSGRLGHGDTDEARHQSKPIQVSDLSDVTQLSAGQGHTCALLSSQKVKCWGWNAYGQLGITSGQNAASPELIPGLPPLTAVTAGGSQTCAQTATGILCWGANQYGQLGNGQTEAATTPVTVSGL